jgi:hypothetical protein
MNLLQHYMRCHLEKHTCVLTLVAKTLSAGQIHDPKRSLTHPGHEWILPRGDLQWVPYVAPHEQKVPKQRVPKQKVTLEEGEPAKDMPSQLLTLTLGWESQFLVPISGTPI